MFKGRQPRTATPLLPAIQKRMDSLKLAIKERQETGRQVTQVRAEDRIPGVIYGHETDNRNVSVDYNSFAKVHKAGGESTLVELDQDGTESVKVLIKDTQRDPITDRYTHIDFYKVNLKEKTTAEISLVFEGESAAVKAHGGFLQTPNDAVEVEALPDKLPHDIKVDISKLETFDDVIRAGDLPLPEGVELVTDAERTIAFVNPPKSEEEIEAEEAAMSEPADVSEIKTESEEKKEAEAAEKAAEGEGEKKSE